jgi:hypothetical protein
VSAKPSPPQVAGVGTAWSAPPGNDTYAGATPVTLPYVSGPVDTTEATLDQDDIEVEAACGIPPDFFTPANSVWYTFTATSDAVVAIDTSQSDYAILGAVVTGSPGSFTAVSCFLGGASFDVQAGQSYHAVFYGAYGVGGTLEFSLTPGQPPSAVVNIDKATFTPKTGLATVSGRASCTDGASGDISGTLSQTVGRFQTIRGDFFVSLVCDGSTRAWSAQVRPYSGKFGGGRATVDYSYEVSSPFGYSQGSGSVGLRLQSR